MTHRSTCLSKTAVSASSGWPGAAADSAVALVRGVGSQIHAIGHRGIDAFIATFGQP